MKLSFKVSDKVTVDAEGSTVKELFENLACLVEVFSNTECNCCKSTNVIPRKRTVAGDNYYEMYCQGCGASLGMGQIKADPGMLFPRRRNTKTKEPIGKWGWEKWQDRNDGEESAPEPAATSKKSNTKTAPKGGKKAEEGDENPPF